MCKYQIIKKPTATASGDPGEWSFVAHGAVYTTEEAQRVITSIERFGAWKAQRIAI